MRNKKRFVALMLAGIMVAGTACGNGGSKDGGAKGENTIYNTFVGADPESIDAQKGNDVYGNTIVNNVYEPLIRLVQNDDLTLKPEAGAAGGGRHIHHQRGCSTVYPLIRTSAGQLHYKKRGPAAGLDRWLSGAVCTGLLHRRQPVRKL